MQPATGLNPQDGYQTARYVFDELSAGPAAHVARAVAQATLSNLPEAEAALADAEQLSPNNPEALANRIVLAAASGKTAAATDALYACVRQGKPD